MSYGDWCYNLHFRCYVAKHMQLEHGDIIERIEG